MELRHTRAFEPLSDPQFSRLLAIRTSGGFHYLRLDGEVAEPQSHLGEVRVSTPFYDWQRDAEMAS